MRRKIVFAGLLLAMLFTVSVKADSGIIGANTVIDNIEKSQLPKINIKEAQKLKKVQEPAQKPITKDKKKSKIEKYRDKLFNSGVILLDDNEEDCVKVLKSPDKKSKIAGYAVDGNLVTVIEQTGKWYKVKSGKITGYIKTKNVVVDDDVESILIDNQNVKATFVKDQVKLKSEAKGSNVAIGMGYKNTTYPVIGFSNDDKKVRIQRTESIAGWVSIDTVKIEIDAEGLLTEDEYKKYQAELERRQQEELQKILNMSISATGNKLLDSILSLVAHNESGNYAAARNGLPQYPGEKTITVGAWQWYGERAHNLLRTICNTDSSKSKKIIKDAFSGTKAKRKKKADKLYSDIQSSDSWESTKRTFSKEELIAVKSLLGSEIGIVAQQAQAKSDLSAKISVAKNTYGLKNNQLIVYFCDLFWQNPENARKITSACIKHFEGANKFSKDKKALKYMHEQAMKNPVMGKFVNRRNYTYSVCKGIK